MLSLRTRIFVIISFIVLVILAISLILIVSSRNKKKDSVVVEKKENILENSKVIDNNNFDTTSMSGVGTTPTPTAGLKSKPEPKEDAIKNGVKQLAKIFIERYGSYSTDSNHQNILDVKSLVTPLLWQKLSSQIKNDKPNSFLGMTTQVISLNLEKWEEDKAKIVLETQRIEVKNKTTNKFNQTVNVEIVKLGNDWLVDSFEWK